jgi:hypothetical protein
MEEGSPVIETLSATVTVAASESTVPARLLILTQ